MTSNIGSDIILTAKSITQKIRKEVDVILNRTFRPEFLNRIDAICFFRKLDEKDIVAIAKIHLKKLEQRLKEQNIMLTISNDVVKKIAKLGYSVEFGARPLKRAIQAHVAVPISQYILKHPQSREIKAKVEKDAIVIT